MKYVHESPRHISIYCRRRLGNSRQKIVHISVTELLVISPCSKKNTRARRVCRDLQMSCVFRELIHAGQKLLGEQKSKEETAKVTLHRIQSDPTTGWRFFSGGLNCLHEGIGSTTANNRCKQQRSLECSWYQNSTCIHPAQKGFWPHTSAHRAGVAHLSTPLVWAILHLPLPILGSLRMER